MTRWSVVILLAVSHLPLFSFGNEAGWWQIFDNPHLDSIVETGLGVHPNIKASVAAIQSAEAMRNEARHQIHPEASINLGLRAGRENTMYTDRQTEDTDPLAATARLRWELDLFGRIGSSIDAAEAGIRAAEADRDGIALVLSTDLVRTTVDLVRLKAKEQLLEKVYRAQTRIVEHISARVTAGMLAQPEYHQAEAQRLMLLQEQETLQLRTRKQEAVLTALLGGTPWEGPLPTLAELQTPNADPLLVQTNEVTRPDVTRAWWRWQQKLARDRSDAQARKPTLAIVATAAGESSKDGDIEPWKAWVGPVLELPLWQPKLAARNQRSQAEAERAKQQFESISLQALREMHVARIDLEAAEGVHAHLSARATEFKEIEEQQKRLRAAGLIQREELLRAEQDSLQAQIATLPWSTRRFTAYIDWIRATGGTLQASGR